MSSNKWTIKFTSSALRDLNDLDGSVKKIVLRAIDKVSVNPLPQNEGGYGKPLGNRNGHDLSGLLKIKLRDSGIRIIYELKRTEHGMSIVIIGARTDNEVYRQVEKRIKLN